jgi:hypothetical protein
MSQSSELERLRAHAERWLNELELAIWERDVGKQVAARVQLDAAVRRMGAFIAGVEFEDSWGRP